MMRLPIACLALLAATPAAAAENWVRIGGDGPVAGEFVDAESLVRTGDRVRFNFEIRYAATRPEGWDRQAFTGLASCADRKAAILATSMHLGDHTLLSATYREDRSEVEAVTETSPLGRALAFACGSAPAAG